MTLQVNWCYTPDCQIFHLLVLKCTKREQEQYCMTNVTSQCNKNSCTSFFAWWLGTSFTVSQYSVTLCVHTKHLVHQKLSLPLFWDSESSGVLLLAQSVTWWLVLHWRCRPSPPQLWSYWNGLMLVRYTAHTALQVFSCRAKSVMGTSVAEAGTVYCSEASCNT